ncbi:MAG TPA: thiamine phosphate synthase [Chthoniobacterales bacterium]|nr:thiamine phosphate synthase [Chthoniobacterales bacterium]
MRNLTDCRLYGILDLGYVTESEAERVTAAMIEGGVDLIQLRAKKSSVAQIADLAGRLHEMTSVAGVPLIVNDHAEIAAKVLVEGVHVGQDDDSIARVREKAGRKIIVGKSTHSLDQANAAQREGADYIGFGPIFATPTKPDYNPIGMKDIKRVHADVALPIFCIGGIKIDNLGEVLAAGARRVAIVSGFLKAPDIAKYGRACKSLLEPET